MDIVTWLGTELPETYSAYLQSNPDEQTVGDVLLYESDSLVERNETYETKQYCPGFITIGDDGGGQAIMLNLSDSSIHVVGHGVMSADWMEMIADSFSSWLDQGCPLVNE